MYSLAAFIHIVVLLMITWYSLRSYDECWLHKSFAVLILVWSNLVITALFLSLFSALGSLPLYFFVSIILAIVTALVVPHFTKSMAANYSCTIMQGKSARSWLMTTSLILLLICFICTSVICLLYYPNNWDTESYRFGRVFLYLGQGNLSHIPCPDSRLSVYPFNGTLAYLYFAEYALDGRWFNLLSLIFWSFGVAGCFAFARDLGASKTGSLIAAAIFGTTPIVATVAASTNDEIIAAVPLLIGLIFLFRWWKSRNRFDSIVSGLALGLSAGTKLHIVFFVPITAVVAIILLIILIQKKMVRTVIRERGKGALVIIIIAIFLFVPFMIVNISQGGFTFFSSKWVNPLLNKPFDAGMALKNTTLFSSQLFLSPIPDLIISPDDDFKRKCYQNFNDFFNKLVFNNVNDDKNYSFAHYRFRGVANPDGFYSFEQTFWLGFIPFLFVYGLITLYRNRKYVTFVPFILIILFFSWHFARSMLTKYIETTGVYYVYPFTIAAMAIAAIWDLREHQGRIGRKITLIGFSIIILSNGIFLSNLFIYNIQRNFSRLYQSHFILQQKYMSREVVKAMQESPKMNFIYTRRGFPYFQFAARSPETRFTTDTQLDPTKVDILNLMIYPFRSEYGHIPIKVPHPQNNLLTLMGYLENVYGREGIFGFGGNGREYNTYGTDYNLLHYKPIYDENASIPKTLVFSPKLEVPLDSPYQFRLLVVEPSGSSFYLTEWIEKERIRMQIPLPPIPSGSKLKVQMRLRSAPLDITETLFPLDRGIEWDISQKSITPTELDIGKRNRLEGEVFRCDLIENIVQKGFSVNGMREPEGPYEKWQLPRVRWANNPVVTLTVSEELSRSINTLSLMFSIRPQIRPSSSFFVRLNNKIIKKYELNDPTTWVDDVIELHPMKGLNKIELISRSKFKVAAPSENLHILFRSLMVTGKRRH